MDTRDVADIIIDPGDRTSLYIRALATSLRIGCGLTDLHVLTTRANAEEIARAIAPYQARYIIRFFDSTIYPEQIEEIRSLQDAVLPRAKIIWVFEELEEWPTEAEERKGEIFVYEQEDGPDIGTQLHRGFVGGGSGWEHRS